MGRYSFFPWQDTADSAASMNRRKKGNQILKARAKKANAKLAPQNKPKYVSKADRAALASSEKMEYLFSYGTLQQDEVQLANFGHLLIGEKDILPEYVLDEIEITDERVIRESGKNIHPILKYTGNASDDIHGMVFQVTQGELEKADLYEVSDYKRVSVKLQSGTTCWVYVAALRG